MTERRVVVTGMGLITSLGTGVARNWDCMLRGESGVRPIQRFDVSTMEVRIASEVAPLPHVPEDDIFPELGIHSRFALVAGRQAWEDAGLAGAGVPAERVGVYLGSGKGIVEPQGLTEPTKAARAQSGGYNYAEFLGVAVDYVNALGRLEERYYQSGAHLAQAIDARGPNWVCITACAAGNHAIGEAFWALRRGEADVILAGGTHSQIDLMSLSGYATLGALSTRNDEPHRASRPFDRLRDGFILGEGSGVLVLEEYEHARRRGAPIHAEVIGYANTADCYRVTDPHPEGSSAEQAMRNALKNCGLQPGDIDYINAHGTSTAQNDAMESGAIERLFGPKGTAPPVSSTKSVIGHLIAAAGAVEAIACIRALQEGVVPPTANYENPDPACALDYVGGDARPAKLTHAMNNSFGFGGQNIVTVFRRFDG
ncbi:MAG: beta-ketoacyl-[acyl-carrier-protein] synthase family protein [Planctomycetota bacterium]